MKVLEQGLCDLNHLLLRLRQVAHVRAFAKFEAEVGEQFPRPLPHSAVRMTPVGSLAPQEEIGADRGRG